MATKIQNKPHNLMENESKITISKLVKIESRAIMLKSPSGFAEGPNFHFIGFLHTHEFSYAICVCFYNKYH